MGWISTGSMKTISEMPWKWTSDLLEEAANLVYQATALLNGEDIEAECCFPCCVVEVFCDDEF